MVFWRVIPLLALVLATRAAQTTEQYDVKAHYTKQEVRVTMRDGVRLFTAIYSPKDTSINYPILMTRTPYGARPYGPENYPKRLGPSLKFAEDGFIFVYQDVRGRYMSEGEFVEERPEDGAGINESTDTYDTIDWLVKNLPNNNGKVGLIGTSYPGFYTTCGLINAHPALLAASPQASMSDLYMGDDAYHNGALFLIANFSFYTSFGKQHNPELPPAKDDTDFSYGTNDGYQFYLKAGSIGNLDENYFKYRNSYWTDVVKHWTYDTYWKSRDILPQLQNIKPAVLVVGGWYDAEDLSGTLKTFDTIGRQSPATIESLVMGPWIHGGWGPGLKGDHLGDVSFGSNTAWFFQDEMELPFFQHYLKGASDPNLPKAYVFETGKNLWQKKSQWPPADATLQKFYLQANGELGYNKPAATESALDENTRDQHTFDQYTSDPADPVPFYSKPTLDMSVEYMNADQRFVASRPDVLTYQTPPLMAEVTVAGPISPWLFVSTSASDSDFIVKLIDVYPDAAGHPLGGYQQLVRGEPFRGKFRNSFENPQPFQPNQIQAIHFTMPSVYHCFGKGHRIMVQIQSSWFPLVDRNPQTFTDIPSAKPADFVKATERIYRSRDAASFIELSVEP